MKRLLVSVACVVGVLVLGVGSTSVRTHAASNGADAQIIAESMFSDLDSQRHVQITDTFTRRARGHQMRQRIVVRIQKPNRLDIRYGAGVEVIHIGGNCYGLTRAGWKRQSCQSEFFPASFYAWTQWMHVSSAQYRLRTRGLHYVLTFTGTELSPALKLVTRGTWIVDRIHVLPLSFHGTTSGPPGLALRADIAIDYHAHFSIRAPRT